MTRMTRMTRMTEALHLTLMMTSAQIVETLVAATSYSRSQHYPHPEDQTTRSYYIHCYLKQSSSGPCQAPKM